MSAAARTGDTAVTPWIVLKFGGTSVSRRSRWDTIGQLMRRTAEAEQARVLVVVSALSGVTNALQAMCDGPREPATLSAAAEALVQKHVEFCVELGLDAALLDSRFAELRRLAADPRAAAAALAWQAELLAQGELLSSTLGVAYLRAHGFDVAWLDARDWLQAKALPNQNAWSQRLSVSCDYAADAGLRARFAELPPLLITQGFIARADDGGTAILGRGGSDTSAAYFGALLGAKRVEIWTDVP
ncbi:MAG TPA: bifunctional aspartate kinase/diaminopimelate decarboxylase, partial [Arenimonas sp.]|nr:bifunctional aspartate kinase/diaminopimelate decarboxylase [Arenimonas sp.]